LNAAWSGGLFDNAAGLPLYESTLYFEVDSPGFPGGEIRGQITPNPDVFGYQGPTFAGFLADGPRIFSPSLPGPPFPMPGAPYSFGLTGDLPPGAVAALAYGGGNAGTPLDLGFLGMDGCLLLTGIDAGVLSTTNAFGCVPPLPLLVPGFPGIEGQDFYLQWLVIDPGANPLGLTTSDAMRIVIQL
jgi:hypothetical protein